MATNKQDKILLRIILLISLFFSSLSSYNMSLVSATGVASIIKIPAVSGPLAINGNPDDLVWQSAFPVSLRNFENGFIEKCGEAWVAVRGNYLCISARIPEYGRLISCSNGINPQWWSEDHGNMETPISITSNSKKYDSNACD